MMKMQRFALSAQAHRRLISLALGFVTFSFAAVALGAIVVGGSTTNISAHATYTNLQLTPPSGVAAGDLMLASITFNGGSNVNVVGVPTGWTQIARKDNDVNLSVVTYYKIATGADTNTYTWIIDQQTRAVGGITRYSGVSTGNPIDTFVTGSGFSASATTTAVTTSNPNEEVVAVFATDVSKTLSTAAGMTQEYQTSHGTLGPTIAADDVLQVSAGSSGSASSTIDARASRYWVSQQIALNHPVAVSAPTAYWKLDESSGDAADATGNGHTMTNFGSTPFTAGLINNGADLGSNNSTRAFATPSSLGFANGPFSAAIWAKMYAVQAYSGNIMLYSACDNPVGTCMSIHIMPGTWDGNTGTVRCDLNGDPSHDVQKSVTLGTTAFHQFAWTFDGSTLTCYVDGISIGSHSDSIQSLAPNNSFDGTAIGALGGTAWNDLHEQVSAIVDEVGAWNHALTPAEVTALYNNGAGASYPF